jgi:hypothetical protein
VTLSHLIATIILRPNCNRIVARSGKTITIRRHQWKSHPAKSDAMGLPLVRAAAARNSVPRELSWRHRLPGADYPARHRPRAAMTSGLLGGKFDVGEEIGCLVGIEVWVDRGEHGVRISLGKVELPLVP